MTGALLAWGAISFASTAPNEGRKLVVGTGGVAGFYYPAGGAVCRLVNAQRATSGLHCLVESTAGSIQNLSALRKGEIDLAVVQSGWLAQAVKGQGLFARSGADGELRSLFSLHGEPLTLLARKDSGIESVSDLKGKKVSLGKKSSVQRSLAETLLDALGWKAADLGGALDIDPDEQVKALCEGRIDAAFFLIAHPVALVGDAYSGCGAHMVAIDGKAVKNLLAKNPQFAAMTIPGGLYPGNPKPTETFGVKAVLAARTNLPADVAYQLVQDVFDHLDQLWGQHPTLEHLTPSAMASETLVAPVHDGAQRYFKEKGLGR